MQVTSTDDTEPAAKKKKMEPKVWVLYEYYNVMY